MNVKRNNTRIIIFVRVKCETSICREQTRERECVCVRARAKENLIYCFCLALLPASFRLKFIIYFFFLLPSSLALHEMGKLLFGLYSQPKNVTTMIRFINLSLLLNTNRFHVPYFYLSSQLNFNKWTFPCDFLAILGF